MSSTNPSLTRMSSMSPRTSLFLSDDNEEGGYGCDRIMDTSNERKNATIESILYEDEDDEDIRREKKEKRRRVVLAATAVAGLSIPVPRASAFFRDRLDWEKHIQNFMNEGHSSLRRFYRMEYKSFQKLVDLLRPHLEGNKEMSRLRTGGTQPIISPEMKVHCLLRFLAGGSVDDIRIQIGIHKSTFYQQAVNAAIDAVLAVNELKIRFPETREEIEEAAEAYENISSHQVIQGCVACLDGMLLNIQTPTDAETGNSKAFFLAIINLMESTFKLPATVTVILFLCSQLRLEEQMTSKRIK